MEASIDAAGRIVVPKQLRDELGLTAGTRVDISRYGAGLAVLPHGRTARVELDGRHLAVVDGDPVDDETVFRLLDESREWPRH